MRLVMSPSIVSMVGVDGMEGDILQSLAYVSVSCFTIKKREG